MRRGLGGEGVWRERKGFKSEEKEVKDGGTEEEEEEESVKENKEEPI